jgi:acetylornithine/N-succinyldiaminopimelate aminotransferase
MTLAKGLGGGFPIGACLATARVAGAMTPGTHGSTFGGNPLACAVAGGVLDVILEDGFLEHVEEVGKLLSEKMQRLAAAFPGIVAGIRGRGLLLGIEIKEGFSNADVVASLMERNLLTVPAADNVVRIIPPLIIGEAEIDEAISSIEDLFQALADDITGDPVERTKEA